MQLAQNVLPEQQLWSVAYPPLPRDALHDFLRRAIAVAPILPGTIVFLRARTDGTWADGHDKPRSGRVGGGGGGADGSSSGGSRSTRPTHANRLRWGLVTEPPVGDSPSHPPDAGTADTVMRGTEEVGMAMGSSAPPATQLQEASATADITWIANPSGCFEASLPIDRWRVVNRDFQEDAMQALSEAAGVNSRKGPMLSRGCQRPQTIRNTRFHASLCSFICLLPVRVNYLWHIGCARESVGGYGRHVRSKDEAGAGYAACQQR